jgi:probable F420-dependent oxidoreductase
MTHPFSFGLQAYTAESPAQWRELARMAEDLGYRSFHLADHYLGGGPALDAANHPPQNVAAVPAMAIAAEATSTIKIGCRVLCVDYHHPVVLAKEMATIDWFSGGRTEIGLGAGWIASEYDAMGIALDRPGVRIERLEETVGLFRAAFTGELLEVAGSHVHAVGFNAAPALAHVPPIMIGGGSPRVLRLAGRIADIVSINFDNSAGKIGPAGVGSGTQAGTTDKVAWIRDGAGERFGEIEIEIGAYFTVVTDDAPTVRAGFGQMFGLSADDIAAHPHCLMGTVEEICDILEERRETYGISYVTVGAPNVAAFAPVVARLSGT